MFSYLRDYNISKFEKKTYPYVFIGYSPLHKGHHCLYPQTNQVYICRHVIFDELEFSFANKTSTISILQKQIQMTIFPNLDEWFHLSNVDPTQPILPPNISIDNTSTYKIPYLCCSSDHDTLKNSIAPITT